MSIIVRTRNRLDLLARAVDDIFAQIAQEFEIIIVDDADDAESCRQYVASLAPERVDRVRLVSRADRPHGRWLAANAGLDVARGEFVALHDDDDFWDPEFLSLTTRYLDEHPATPAVCSRTSIVIERPTASGGLAKTDTYTFLPELSGISLIDMLRANRIPPISMLYRRSLHEEFGLYDSSLSFLGDWEFYLRVVASHPIALLDGRPLAYWSHRPESAGDDSNSISAASLRSATDDQIRDAYVRRGIAEHGMAPFVHVAHEAKWLEQRLGARIDQTGGSLAERTDRIVGQLDALGHQIASLHHEVTVLRSELYRRTSVSEVLLRPLRTLRARQRR